MDSPRVCCCQPVHLPLCFFSFLCRGVLVIATPYACGFDHFRIADEAQFRMDRCLRVLTSADTEEAAQIRDLPVFGVGHSLGALTHLLIGMHPGQCVLVSQSYARLPVPVSWTCALALCPGPVLWPCAPSLCFVSVLFPCGVSLCSLDFFRWQQVCNGSKNALAVSMRWSASAGSRYAVQRAGNVLLSFNNKVSPFHRESRSTLHCPGNQYRTVQRSIILCSKLPCGTVQYSKEQYSTVQYSRGP